MIEETIIERVRSYADKFDYVFTTGGIGPTHDDITTAVYCEGIFCKTYTSPRCSRLLWKSYYDPGTLTEARLKMADIPEGATLIDNPVSGAPGIQIKNVFIMAGVPKLCKRCSMA